MTTATLSRQRVYDLHVRGELPRSLRGSLVIAASRRNKDPRVFSRWHDSQADLLRMDIEPGRPGRVRVHEHAVDPTGETLADPSALTAFDRQARLDPEYGYATQPNHGLNVEGATLWATNLLFGAPLELDLDTLQAVRIVRAVTPSHDAPRLTGAAHFAWSHDRRHAYFHQALLAPASDEVPVRSVDSRLVELDTRTGDLRSWSLLPPSTDADPAVANFHSAFYFVDDGRPHVGLLRTGAVLESLAPHAVPAEHAVARTPPSTVWIVPIDHGATTLQAQELPGVRALGAISLSHLDCDNRGDGFTLFANYKQTDVAEETHGTNVYGEDPASVREHYSGMTVEPLAPGLVMRYEHRRGRSSMKTFARSYDPCRTSGGHTWMPINIQLDRDRDRLFCSFAGFHPRLLPRHLASSYPDLCVDYTTTRYIPPLLMRFDAATLQPDADSTSRCHLAYAEPMAMTVAGDGDGDEFVCTFSPETGLRVLRAADLGVIVAHAVGAELQAIGDEHFRPDPAHMVFVAR